MSSSLTSSLLNIVLASAISSSAPPERPKSHLNPIAIKKAAPLIERDLFFHEPDFSHPCLSPDGQLIAFLAPWNGHRNLWVKRRGEDISQARLMTDEKQHLIHRPQWSRDGQWLLYSLERRELRSTDLCVVNPLSVPSKGEDAPPSRHLTDANVAQARVLHFSRKDPDLLYMALNDRDMAAHDIYSLRISTGLRSLILTNTLKMFGFAFNGRDELCLGMRMNAQQGPGLLSIDGFEALPVFDCRQLEECVPVGFHEDGKRIYVKTNGQSDLTRLILLDPATGRKSVAAQDPEGKGDIADLFFSQESGKLLAASYYGEKRRTVIYDQTLKGDHQQIKKALPEEEIRYISASRDGNIFLLMAQSDRNPGSCYTYDRKKRQLNLEFHVKQALDRQQMARKQFFHYRSSDGKRIGAYLTLPLGPSHGKAPMVVLPHGGPWLRNDWAFDGEAQFLANRGYAVLQANFRGSTGQGKAFVDSGNRQWGRKMQDDLTWGVKHAIKMGWVDPKRIGILGRSYGGYAAMAGAAFTPDLYKAAISINGPSNLVALMQSLPDFWSFEKAMLIERIGDTSTPESIAALNQRSPLHARDRIQTPMLLIQGGNDPRAKWEDTEKIVISLKDRAIPVMYLCPEKEGHALRDPATQEAVHAAMEAFLAKHLGGRAQTSLSKDAAAKLKEITVDPASIKKPVE